MHLLADRLEGRFHTQLREIRPNVSVGVLAHLLEVAVLGDFHIARLDSQDVYAPHVIRHADIQFAVEAAEAAQGGVDNVGAVGGRDNHDVRGGFNTIHEREQLGDNAALHLSAGLVSLGGDGVDLVDEDDRRRVLLRLLEGLAQVGLRLARQLGHDLGPIQQEEICPCLCRHCLRNHRLARARRPVHQHTTGRGNAHGAEDLGVAQGQLDELSDLRELPVAPPDIVISDLTQALVLLPPQRSALAEDLSVLAHNAVFSSLVSLGINVRHLKLNRAHTPPCDEGIAHLQGTGLAFKVGLDEYVEQVPTQPLYCVLEGQHLYRLGHLYVRQCGYGNYIAQT
mmetsp:Transcript_28922/g.62307  ORF Transcript_28922/g.62307 Transcript_28922/m.62307 type:complete len:339 (-) Transcript_28922:583-1599(-)